MIKHTHEANSFAPPCCARAAGQLLQGPTPLAPLGAVMPEQLVLNPMDCLQAGMHQGTEQHPGGVRICGQHHGTVHTSRFVSPSAQPILQHSILVMQRSNSAMLYPVSMQQLFHAHCLSDCVSSCLCCTQIVLSLVSCLCAYHAEMHAATLSAWSFSNLRSLHK